MDPFPVAALCVVVVGNPYNAGVLRLSAAAVLLCGSAAGKLASRVQH